jgi:hypothetical protein
MVVIELNRKRSVLRIGDNSTEIDRYINITVIYKVTHVTHCGDGWYDIYSGKAILGHITDVESVKEKW